VESTANIHCPALKKLPGYPDILNVSRKQRIAKGCGMDISEVNRFMKQFEETRKMMKKMTNMMSGKGSKKRRRGGLRFPFGF